MNDRLLVICPSRGRPNQLNAALDSAINNQSTNKCDYIVALDDDDEQNYVRRTDVQYVIYPRGTSCVIICNEIALQYIDQYICMITYADDVRMNTVGWDQIVLDKFIARNGWAIIYGSDGFHGPTLATHSFMGSKIVKALGWILMPRLIHLWADHVVMDIGSRLQVIEYVPDLLMEHLHHTAGKSPMDDTYKAYWNPEVHGSDNGKFHYWQAHDAATDIERIRLAMEQDQ